MRFSTLGSSGLEVSRVCLGSMTWGSQNNQHDANQQIDYALSRGINFIDTAEMYAVPPSPESYGKTETIIGHWLAANPTRRKDMVLTSKIAGPGLPYIRNGGRITGESIIAALDDSLKRLQTDYIDLYQLHWPNRTSPHFGKHHVGKISFSEVDAGEQREQMLEILQALNECILAGKIRHCGLSDDTPWGIQQYIQLSKEYALPRMVSIQNEFNLLHTKDWPYLIENCIHEDIAYLPWSPLAGGVLTGKYLNGVRPAGSRWTSAQRNGLFRDTPQVELAVAAYVDIAKRHNTTSSHLALAWCDQVDGVSSSIIGATTLAQLTEDIAAFAQPLSKEIIEEISQVMALYPAPF